MTTSPGLVRPGASRAADRIVSTALRMGLETGWYDLSLVDLARRCGMDVNRLRRRYPDTNAIADAWFTSALEAMLAPPPEAFDDWPARDRLEVVLWRWFEALSPHHRVTVQMLRAKLHPPHIHHWIGMPFDLSQLVQLWRDASGLHAGGRRRQVEEIALTGIFLATLNTWIRDPTPGREHARDALRKRLDRAQRAARHWLGGP